MTKLEAVKHFVSREPLGYQSPLGKPVEVRVVDPADLEALQALIGREIQAGEFRFEWGLGHFDKSGFPVTDLLLEEISLTEEGDQDNAERNPLWDDVKQFAEIVKGSTPADGVANRNGLVRKLGEADAELNGNNIVDRPRHGSLRGAV